MYARLLQVVPIPAEDLAYSNDIECRKIFVRLLNASLRSFLGPWRMCHSKESDCLYFAPGKKNIEREHRSALSENITMLRGQGYKAFG